jgi:DEAD/DEAH box helicase domain-containing protein
MIEQFIKDIKKRESYRKQIVHLEKIPAQEAVYGQLDKPLPEVIQNFLVNDRIQLYSHQAEAINKIRDGKNVVIVTPTASGKTLAFNIPVFEALLKDNK